MAAQLSGEKILITGATGQVANPVAKGLARDNEVWAVARFGNADVRKDLEAAGVHCAVVDLAVGDYSGVPTDITYGLHFARASAAQWGADLDTNVGGLAFLMEFCKDAKAFLHCSSTAVYQPNGNTPRFKEDDPLGDNHRVYAGFVPDMETYSITKIAAEGVARWGARRFDLPTTIARLNVPYGDAFSWPGFHLEMILGDQPVPVYIEEPSEYNPIHDDDVLAMIPGMLAIASVPATTVNWGGSDVVSIQEWCAYLGELVGVEPKFFPTEQTLASVSVDTTRMEELVGKPSVYWKDGFRRLVESKYPDRLKSDA
jgi:nucleoside-diphosphate-sugar epimerase